MTEYLKTPLTEEESRFAEDQFGLVDRFLKKNRLSSTRHYDTATTSYLISVRKYLELDPELPFERYFENRLRRELHRKRQSAEADCYSLELLINADELGSLVFEKHDQYAGSFKPRLSMTQQSILNMLHAGYSISEIPSIFELDISVITEEYGMIEHMLEAL